MSKITHNEARGCANIMDELLSDFDLSSEAYDELLEYITQQETMEKELEELKRDVKERLELSKNPCDNNNPKFIAILLNGGKLSYTNEMELAQLIELRKLINGLIKEKRELEK